MSYDVSINEPARHGVTYEVWESNITYNLGPMLGEAGIDLKDLDGAVCGAIADRLQSAAAAMANDPPRFEAHNPSNGWGDYVGCLEFVRDFAVAAESTPTGIVLVS